MLYAIGDVHSHNKELCALLDKVKFDKDKDHLFLLGDLFNRGDEPIEAWTTYLDLKASGCVTPLIGNHELFTLEAIHGYMRSGRLDDYFSDTYGDRIGEVVDELMSWQLQVSVELNGESILMAHGMTYLPKEAVLHDAWDFALPRRGLDDYFENGIPGYLSVIGHHSKLMYDHEDLYINDKKNVYMIDNGCGQGGSLVCMCLDTKEIIYS